MGFGRVTWNWNLIVITPINKRDVTDATGRQMQVWDWDKDLFPAFLDLRAVFDYILHISSGMKCSET